MIIKETSISVFDFQRWLGKNKFKIADSMTLPDNKGISRFLDKMMLNIEPQFYGIVGKSGVITILSTDINIITYFCNDNVYYTSKKFTKGAPISIVQDNVLRSTIESRKIKIISLFNSYGSVQEIEEFFEYKYTAEEITQFLES
jgi:hypothetical protein